MPISQGPEIVAHRGWASRYPENTLLALEAAMKEGARFVELDVQLTADGVPVVFHDAALDRVCGIPGDIRDVSFRDSRALRCPEPGRFGGRFKDEVLAPLSGLASLLNKHPGVTAFVELKDESLSRFGIAPMLDAVSAAIAPIATRCVLISYTLAALEAARRRGLGPIGAVVDQWADTSHPRIAALDPEYLFCDVNGLPAQGRIAFRRARIAVFEVPDAPRARALFTRGVSLIETFAFGELRAHLLDTSDAAP